MKELNLEQMSSLQGGCDATSWAGFWTGLTAFSILGGPAAFVAAGTVSIIGNAITGAVCDNPYWK